MTDRKTLKQQWFATYEQALVTQVPALRGKIDWQTATFFFNRGDAARDAADRMAKRYADHDTAN